MSHPLEELREAALREIDAAVRRATLEAARVKYLGRSGSISAWGEQMKTLGKEEKPIVGKLLNEVRTAVTAAIDERAGKFQTAQETEALANIDISLPGTPSARGSLHPLTQMLDRAIAIFPAHGFRARRRTRHRRRNGIASTRSTRRPIIRRATSRTHFICRTADCSARTLPPCRSAPCNPRRRRFASSRPAPPIAATKSTPRTARSSIRSKAFYVDENVSVADLKGTLEFFMRELFGADTAVRFRPHYFPFTEPSFEIDVKSKALKGGEQWIEVCGSGMVHPAVFEEVNKARGDDAYDPEKWTGFAFGLGMDRLAMILFDIPDIRLFAQNDLRFLKQFA